MSADLRSFVVKTFTGSIEGFLKDLDALSHEDLKQSFGKSSRTAYDFIYEVGIINQRVATRCRGEDPGPMPWTFGDGWLSAPAEFYDKEASKQHIQSTGDAVLAAVGEDVERSVAVGENMQPVYQLVLFAAEHTQYHDAQLNFIQAMVGDLAVHW